jgi:hypothetical protein
MEEEIMNVIYCNPDDFDKMSNYEQGLAMCLKWLQLNRLSIPRFRITRMTRGHRGLYSWKRPNTVFVNLKLAVTPPKTPGFRWSFTGYKADMTPAGICAHEVGHHANYERGWRKIQDLIPADVYAEDDISGYVYNQSELIAESIKLFILNPNLLKIGRPAHWKFVTRTMRLKPLHDIPWQDVLKFAHPKFIKAAQNWIAK